MEMVPEGGGCGTMGYCEEGGYIPMASSKAINTGPTSEVNPDIILPRRNLNFELPHQIHYNNREILNQQ